jgi:hypothetical protein
MTVNHVGGSGGSQTPNAQSADVLQEMESTFESTLNTARGVTDQQWGVAQPAVAEFAPISYGTPYSNNLYDDNPNDSGPDGEQSGVTGNNPYVPETDLLRALAKAVADHPALGDPYTFGPGERAQALVDLAMEAFPDADVPLFDEVIFDPEIPFLPEEAKPVAEFSVGKGGKRFVTVRVGMLDLPLARQLMIAIHELVHAEQWRDGLSANGGDLAAAGEQFPGFYANSQAYAMREIETESRALSLAENLLGSLPPEDVERSKRYIESWQNFLAAARGEAPPASPAPEE